MGLSLGLVEGTEMVMNLETPWVASLVEWKVEVLVWLQVPTEAVELADNLVITKELLSEERLVDAMAIDLVEH
jgi:hypothetical protein